MMDRFWDFLLGKEAGKKEYHELVKTVRRSDAGKKQAKEQLKSMMESDDPEVLNQIAKARIRLYSQAAYEGDEQAQYRVGLSQAKLGNKEVSLEWLTGLAKKGDVKAMKAIARGYAQNGIYGYSREEYRHWTQKAAEAGDAQAQADLGLFYAAKNEKLSRYWYQKSAKQNWPAGCVGLGKAYYNEALLSFGKQEDGRREALMQKAEQCFLMAANGAAKNRDFAEACHELGVFYETTAPGEETAKRAAYFYYQAWSGGKQNEDREAFERIRDKYGLKVHTEDPEKWEHEIFG